MNWSIKHKSLGSKHCKRTFLPKSIAEIDCRPGTGWGDRSGAGSGEMVDDVMHFCFGFCDFRIFYLPLPAPLRTRYRASIRSPLSIWVKKCTYNACPREICALLISPYAFDLLLTVEMSKIMNKMCKIW